MNQLRISKRHLKLKYKFHKPDVAVLNCSLDGFEKEERKTKRREIKGEREKERRERRETKRKERRRATPKFRKKNTNDKNKKSIWIF